MKISQLLGVFVLMIVYTSSFAASVEEGQKEAQRVMGSSDNPIEAASLRAYNKAKADGLDDEKAAVIASAVAKSCRDDTIAAAKRAIGLNLTTSDIADVTGLSPREIEEFRRASGVH